MADAARHRSDPDRAIREDWHSLARELVTLGEARAAIDLLRREVNYARSSVPNSPTLVRLLRQYAAILESTESLAEAEFIRAESLEVVAGGEIGGLDAVDAFLESGLLLCKMHNYDGAVARLKEAVSRVEQLEDVAPLRREVILAQAWRGQSQAFEQLGEFSQASNAMDVLMNVKRQLRLLVFSPLRGR